MTNFPIIFINAPYSIFEHLGLNIKHRLVCKIYHTDIDRLTLEGRRLIYFSIHF